MHFSYWRGNHWDKILSVVYLFAPKCVTCERVLVRLLKRTFVLVTVSLWGLKPDWCWWLFVECLAGSDNKLISGSLDIISPHNLWRLYHSPLCPMSPLTTDKGRNAKWLNIWICVEFWDILRRINQPPRQWGRLWWWEGMMSVCGDQCPPTNNVKIDGHTEITHTLAINRGYLDI